MMRRRLGFRKWRREELGSWWPGPGKAPGKLALGVVPALLLCLQGAPGVAARPPEASSPAVARTQCEETDAEIIVDLEVLEDSLRHTRAVGPMTKLKIKREEYALEQEMLARTQEMRARVVEAEAPVPLAMAEAFRRGNLGVMDYYKYRNIQADTQMREAIGGTDVEKSKGRDH